MLASLVIVSHSAEMIDGNRSREALTQFGGIMTFGELAVDGFFIVSGYLVVQSFQNSKSFLDYLLKRVRRIYPGFLACAIFVVALSPLIGSPLLSWSWKDYIRAGANLAVLNWPDIRGYPDLAFHALNGSAWSIPYEFRCYILVALLGVLGLYRLRLAVLAFTTCLLVSHAIGWPTYIGPLAKLVGLPQLFIRMAGMFCVGSCFYLYRSVVVYRWWMAMIAFAALIASFSIPQLQETTFAVAGSYLLFYFALGVRSDHLAQINSRADISYGTYLYAWPIAGALIAALQIRSPVLLFSATLPSSLAAGWLSWYMIEQPLLRSKTNSPKSE